MKAFKESPISGKTLEDFTERGFLFGLRKGNIGASEKKGRVHISLVQYFFIFQFDRLDGTQFLSCHISVPLRDLSIAPSLSLPLLLSLPFSLSLSQQSYSSFFLPSLLFILIAISNLSFSPPAFIFLFFLISFCYYHSLSYFLSLLL